MGCWEQEWVLNPPSHEERFSYGLMCSVLTVSPCPQAGSCRSGRLGSQLPRGLLVLKWCWEGWASAPNPCVVVPMSACCAGGRLSAQAGHSYLPELSSALTFLKKIATSKNWCFPCKHMLGVTLSICSHCVQRWRVHDIWYVKSDLYLDTWSLETTLAKGKWEVCHYCLPLWQLLIGVWT